MPTSASSGRSACACLEAHGLEGGYGANQVLFGVDLEVAAGEIVAVVGHNGAGKSTLLRCILGLLPQRRGDVLVEGERVEPVTPRTLSKRGVAYVPQGGGAFASLTARENLLVSASAVCSGSRRQAPLADAVVTFPALVPLLDQRARTLSGGERQMLSLAMGLARNPTVLLADEPSLGLSPGLTDSVMSQLQALRDERGLGVLVVEQRVRQIIAIADRVYVLRNGTVAHSGPAAALRNEEALIATYL